MDIVDRIMRAFIRKRPLTVEQEAMVRSEVTDFAQALLSEYRESVARRQASISKPK